MSRGRRLITTAGIAVAVVFSVRLSQARPDDPPQLTEPAGGVTKDEPKKPTEIEIPDVISNLAPRPENAGTDEGKSAQAEVASPKDGGRKKPPESAPVPGVMSDVPAPAEPAPALTDEGPPPRDDEVIRAQRGAAADGDNPLPGARDRNGQATAPAAGVEASTAEGFVLPADRLPPGPQSAGVTVQVLSPPAMNLHKPATVTIVVKNNGPTDAYGVTVRDQLPDSLKFVSSQPEAQPAGQLVTWKLGTLTAGAERKLKVNVEPIAIGACDHAATVVLKTGARAKTVVMQPKLKVEQVVSRSKVLRGQQVTFDITVTNTGTGPARDVIVRARLSAGLKHEEGRLVELPFSEVLGKSSLGPNESLTLAPLVVDAVDGGEQTCDVEASSPDVVADDAEARSTKEIEVTEPRLKMALRGSQQRYTDTTAEYAITLENPGTAPAQDVHVSATLLGDGRPSIPPGAKWNAPARRLQWTIPVIEPQSKATVFSFQVRLGGVQSFQVNAEATAKGGLREHSSCTTDVTGNADVELEVSERLRVIDVGQMAVFRIRIKNQGTKEANNVLVNAKLSPTLEPVETAGTDQSQKANFDRSHNVVSFPEIARLVPGGEMILNIKVKALKPGLATCRVDLMHKDLPERIEDMAATRVAAPRDAGP